MTCADVACVSECCLMLYSRVFQLNIVIRRYVNIEFRLVGGWVGWLRFFMEVIYILKPFFFTTLKPTYLKKTKKTILQQCIFRGRPLFYFNSLNHNYVFQVFSWTDPHSSIHKLKGRSLRRKCMLKYESDDSLRSASGPWWCRFI